MIVTTYTCDKCGHEQETDEQMWNLGISVEHYGRLTGNYSSPKVEALWCRKCVELLALLPQGGGALDAPPPPSPPPTLEDMIREIIQKEIEDLTP